LRLATSLPKICSAKAMSSSVTGQSWMAFMVMIFLSSLANGQLNVCIKDLARLAADTCLVCVVGFVFLHCLHKLRVMRQAWIYVVESFGFLAEHDDIVGGVNHEV
jgi:hypothetical protein